MIRSSGRCCLTSASWSSVMVDRQAVWIYPPGAGTTEWRNRLWYLPCKAPTTRHEHVRFTNGETFRYSCVTAGEIASLRILPVRGPAFKVQAGRGSFSSRGGSRVAERCGEQLPSRDRLFSAGPRHPPGSSCRSPRRQLRPRLGYRRSAPLHIARQGYSPHHRRHTPGRALALARVEIWAER